MSLDVQSLLTESQKALFQSVLSIKKLGEGQLDSELRFSEARGAVSSNFVPEEECVLAVIDKTITDNLIAQGKAIPAFEKAGPRRKLYFEPGNTISAIVTCGGLCPGLNSVIRGIVMMNYFRYNNQITYGIKYGYAGLIKDFGYDVQLLTPEIVDGIHREGGTILGSSRGNQDVVKMVDRLAELNVKILYTIGGDGTLRGAMAISNEIERRGLKISVIGIPKTIDNDVNYIDKSFGTETAFTEACKSIYAAHTEARANMNGIGIVKVMGRESGFIAANATLATSEVGFCLIPEMDFDLEGDKGFLQSLEQRLIRRKHAVIVVAEGAGQQYVNDPAHLQYDASGNIKLGDVGLYLKDKIKAYLASKGIITSIKYLDPSYSIRSCAPTANDSIFCSQLAQMAVHAGMSGRTGLLVGYLNGRFIHLPMLLATSQRQKIDLDSQLWLSVLETTGQSGSYKN